MNVKEVLSTHFPVFASEELLAELDREGKLVEVPAGEKILRKGAYVKTIPLLITGLVKVIRQEGLKEHLLYYIYPSQSCIVSINCGLNELKSSVRAITEEDSVAVLLPSRIVGDLQRKFPAFNEFILSQYQTRFDDILDAFNALAFQSLDARLLSFLQAKRKATGQVRIHSTHQEIGEELGAARETVSRILKKLEAEKKVKLYRGSVELI